MSLKDYIEAIKLTRHMHKLEKTSYKFVAFWSDGDEGTFFFSAPTRAKALDCTEGMLDKIDEFHALVGNYVRNRTVTSCALFDGKSQIVAEYLLDGHIRIPVLMDDYA
jgi:hypothetical protein